MIKCMVMMIRESKVYTGMMDMDLNTASKSCKQKPSENVKVVERLPTEAKQI